MAPAVVKLLPLLLLMLGEATAFFGCPVTGGCILNRGDESRVPVGGPYEVSDVVSAAGCNPFTQAISAYGLLFTAGTDGQKVPANGLRWLAHATVEIFPASAKDQAGQKKVLENMFRYRASNPVFVGTMVDKMTPAKDELSMCDTITIGMSEASSPNEQMLEVYEHLLHIITDVGLNKAFPSQWGISTNSDLYRAMQEAILKKVYNVDSYARIDEADVRLRIEMQEFAYWALSTALGVMDNYFEGDAKPEWTLSKASELTNTLPLFAALHAATTANILAAPSANTFAALGSLAPGQTPVTAPWPITSPGRSIRTVTTLVNPCSASVGTCNPTTTGAAGIVPSASLLGLVGASVVVLARTQGLALG